MNIQTERLEKQTAKFTVEINPDRLQQAKEKAARELAKRVRIPGFRKGKVPYRVMVQNGLEPQILNDAIDSLSQEIYRETLEQSDVEPYGPGAFEDFQLDPPTFIYTVPLQPTVDLKEYDQVRVDYEAPEVTEEQVERAMRRLQEQEAEVVETEEAAVVGDRITADLHSEFVDDAPEESTEEGETRQTGPEKGASFIHDHDATIRLDLENESILKGFNEQMIGVKAGEEREFELTVPEDDEEYTDIAGRKIQFHVSVKKVENMTLPELNDEFAAKVSENDEEQLTLEQLRTKMRENLFEQLERQTKDAYAAKVLRGMVEQAEIAYPDAMVEEQIGAMIEDFESRIRQQGLTLETYYQVTGSTEDDLKEQYAEQAEDILRRSLVLREIVTKHELEVSEARIDMRIDEMVAQFGDQAAQIRPMFDTPRMRSAMVNDLMNELALEFVARVGKGEDVSNFKADIEAEVAKALEEARAAREAAEAARAEAAAEAASAVAAQEDTIADETGTEENAEEGEMVAEVSAQIAEAANDEESADAEEETKS